MPNAEIDAAFDRWSVPSFVRPGLMELLADAWDRGQADASRDYMAGYDANVAGEPCPTPTPNPYRVTPPEETQP